MKIRNRYLAIMLVVLLLLSGCAASQGEQEHPTETEHDVIDAYGRAVEIPQEIDSVSALYTVAGHIVIMLNQGDKITSCSNGLKRDKLILDMQPSINDIYLPKVGGVVNVEELINSDPDIIFMDPPIYWDESEVEKVENLQIPYYVVAFDSMQEEMDIVRDIGKILGEEEEAQRYIAFYQDVINLTETVVARIPEDERLSVYHSINEVVRTSSDGTITNEWLETAGLINIATNTSLSQDEDKFYTTVEDILYWNPDVLLFNEPTAYEYVLESPAFQNLDAVRNGKVYLLPTGISRWGHATSIETPLAMLWVLKNLYPEYAQDVDLIAYTKRFYSDLYEYELTDEQIDQILSGVDMRKAKNLED